MSRFRGRGRWVALAAAGLLLVAQAISWAPNAQSQTGFSPVDIRGFATSTPVHVGALDTGAGGLRVVDAEVAWSAAAVDADANGLAGTRSNEFDRIIQPDRPNKISYARGSGLELGLGTTNVDANQIQLSGFAEADAAPSSSKTEEIALPIDPVAYASALRGQAVANANDSGLVPDYCILGDDISRGIGYAADVDLLDLGGNANAPALDSPLLSLDDQDEDRAVAQSTSRMKLIPTGGNQFGLMAEVRQSVAPVTLGQQLPGGGDLRILTIEVLGEWVLRAVATGKSGGASVFYGPADDSPSTPVVRILDSEAATPLLLTLQDLLGATGLVIPIPGLADVAIGEDPRAIAAPGAAPDDSSQPALAADGKSASAAVDVVRVRLLDGAVADIRVGHMEASAAVPTGGINCPIPVTKTASPDNLKVGEEGNDTSKITLTVHNVFDCDLTNTKLTDHIKRKEVDPEFQITAANPDPDSPDIPTGTLSEVDVVWSLGTVPKGTTKAVTADLKAIGGSGIIEDIAEAAGTFANCVGQDASGLAINGLDLSGFSIPVEIRVGEVAVTGASTTQTVAFGGGLAVLAALAGVLLRRRSIGS